MLLTRLSELLLTEPEYPDPEVHLGSAYAELADLHYAWHRQVQAFRTLLGVRLVNQMLDELHGEALQGTVGERIRRARVRRGMRQTQLANAVELSNSYLSHIEAGRRPAPPELLDRIAEALGVTAQELTEG
jgi:ribosome-binding protein aMBF1 (putative translation factor)